RLRKIASQHAVGRLVSASLLSTTTTFVSLRLATSSFNSASFFASISVAYTFPAAPTCSTAANVYFPSPAPMSAATVPAFHPINSASRLTSSAASPRTCAANTAATAHASPNSSNLFFFIAGLAARSNEEWEKRNGDHRGLLHSLPLS